MGLYVVFMAQTLILGKTGTGKSTEIRNRILYEIYDGNGLIFIDFNGTVTNDLLHHIPEKRREDVVLFDASNRNDVIGFNIFDDIDIDDRPLVASSVVTAFKSVTGYTMNTPVLDRVLYNSARLALDNNHSLLGMFYLLTKHGYRESLLNRCTDSTIKDFWDEFDKLSAKEKRDLCSSTLSNMEPFITDSAIRNIIGQTKSSFKIKDIMSDKKILLVKAPRHILGDKGKLLSLLLLTSIYTSAQHNSDPFTIFIDDARDVVSPLLVKLMTDLAAFNLSVVASVQNLSQLNDIPILDASSTLISFRLGIDDSKALHKVFQLGDMEHHLHELADYSAFKLMGDCAFRYRVSPHAYPQFPTAYKVVKMSLNDYSSSREIIENKINNFIRGL